MLPSGEYWFNWKLVNIYSDLFILIMSYLRSTSHQAVVMTVHFFCILI